MIYLNIYHHLFLKENTFYEIVNVPRDSTKEEIKKIFRNFSLKYHPDRNESFEEEDFIEYKEHFEVLINEKTKWLYDRFKISIKEH